MTNKETLPLFKTPAAGQIQELAGNAKIPSKESLPGLIAGAQPTFKPTAAPATATPATPPPVQSPQPQPAVVAAPTAVPQTAPKDPEVTAASGQATPQTNSTSEQVTQAPPTPTPTPIPADGGYTADDPNESTRLSQAQVDATGPSLGDMMGSVSKIFTTRFSGKDLADKRYTDPEYIESKQGYDEGGFEGIQNYVTPEAVPGEGTNAVIDWIKKKAAEYTPGKLDRSERLWDEASVLEGRMRDPVSQGYTSQWGTHYSPGYLNPEASKQMQEDVLRQRVENPAPNTGDPSYNPGMLGGNIQQQQQDIVSGRVQAGQPIQPKLSLIVPPQPQQQDLSASQSRAATPLPVPAAKVAEAIYNTDALPPGVSGGSVAMDWIKNLFKSTPKPQAVDELPVNKVPTLTSGESPFIVKQPPLNLPPAKGAVGAIGVTPNAVPQFKEYTDDQGVVRYEIVQ